MRRWRGLKALVHDAVDATTELVEEGHESTSRTVMRVLGAIEPLAEPARAVDEVRRVTTHGVLATIRAVNRAVEVVTDVGLDAAEHAVRMKGLPLEDPAVPMRSDALRTMRGIGDAAMGVVNGAIGDRLHARSNGLDLGMQLRHADAYLPLDAPVDRDAVARVLEGATPKVAVLVHGLMATEWSWCLESEAYWGDPAASFGTLLARDLGYTPIFARYNTGRHVSENGRRLAGEIARLVDAYPVPIEEIVLIGHSMGGLVVRSACHYASEEGLLWTAKVKRVISLGSPHHGAPLERVGLVAARVLGAIDTPGTRIPARLIEARSAGIKDLGRGKLVDEDWLGRDPDALRDDACREIPLLDHAAYHFLSATITADRDHLVAKVIGDLLVLSPSACGERLTHRTFPIDVQHFGGVLHHQLQNHPAVYEQVRRVCAGDA
ncbi:esterase/lipase family protein [Sandaracinus amylolyticus]|uniref:GPI inositol-deacylase PGAP1-like alpha/beta domain-containing protein n=1 Tax=Sandaracinus amylolyticus TaxID=927083 RepID=A0A0F6VYV3_9BACT|nr:alpha/beta fold hydrolase [Sandaracinus amylolyticus]AKF02940.1 hypothetical protein DB32_000088 [Sandaracinus amylolyticus]